MAEDNLLGNQAPRVSSHPVAFHSLKDLHDFCCRDTALPQNGDRPCEKSTACLSQKEYIHKKNKPTRKLLKCFNILPSSILRQLTTVEATISFDSPSHRTPWSLCPSRLRFKKKTRECVSGYRKPDDLSALIFSTDTLT